MDRDRLSGNGRKVAARADRMHRLTRPSRKRLALSFFALILAAALTNPAESGEAGTDTTVASLISSVPPGKLRPVTVIDREDIALSGMHNLWDLLRSRDEFNYFGLHRPFNLGGLRTGILINGRRISDSAYDLDALPISAVERIEILSSSAVAIHGPQAISGTINIVLRNDFEGVEAQVHGESPVGSGGEAGVASALWGGNVGAGHLTVGADVFSRNEVRSADRSYSRASWTPGGSFDDAFAVSVAGNTVFARTEQGWVASPLGPCEDSAYTGPLSEPYGLDGEGCGFAYGNVEWTWERRDRETAFLMADYPIIQDLSVYLDARLADSDYISRYMAPLPDRLSLPGGNGFIFHRYTGHGDRAWRWTVNEHDVTLGVEGRLSDDIHYDAHLRSFSHDEFMRAGTFVHEPAILAAIAAGSYDLANPLSTDPVHLKAVEDAGVRRLTDNITKHQAARVAFDGSGFDLGGRPIGWALGTEFVRESREWLTTYVDGTGNVVEEQKDVIGSFGITFAGERDSVSQFLELSLPLHEIWDVGIAGRYSHHDDVGSTAAGQLETLFEFSDELAFRGSWSKADRAPYLGALNFARVTSVPRIYDPATGRRYQVEAINFGNPDLEPDLAESYGAGFVTKLGPVSASADWYWTKLSRLLTIVRAQTIIDYHAEHRTLPPGHVIHRGAPLVPGTPGLIARIEKPVLGNGETDISGVNVHAHTAWEWDWADFELDARWSHVQDYEERALDFVGPHDFVRNRVHTTLSGTRGKITAQWHVYGTTGYRWRVGRFGSWVGHDLTLRWRDPYGFDGTEILGGILNVFEAEPSINPEFPEYPDDSLDSVRGRTFFVTLKKVW
jgi:iron complex outermembrane receptor protein